jgi:hypothetical protein
MTTKPIIPAAPPLTDSELLQRATKKMARVKPIIEGDDDDGLRSETAVPLLKSRPFTPDSDEFRHAASAALRSPFRSFREKETKMSTNSIWWFCFFEKVIWLGKWIAAGLLIGNGFYWTALALIVVAYFALPMIFIPLRARLGLPPIPGEGPPEPAEIARAKELGISVDELRGLVRSRDR